MQTYHSHNSTLGSAIAVDKIEEQIVYKLNLQIPSKYDNRPSECQGFDELCELKSIAHQKMESAVQTCQHQDGDIEW